jgi:hypothetical protein
VTNDPASKIPDKASFDDAKVELSSDSSSVDRGALSLKTPWFCGSFKSPAILSIEPLIHLVESGPWASNAPLECWTILNDRPLKLIPARKVRSRSSGSPFAAC